MRTRDPLALKGAAVLAGALLLLYVAFTHSVPGLPSNDGRLVRAWFEQTNELRSGDPVRVGGVEVGRVESVRLDAGRRAAEVRMRLENGAPEVRSSARADLRWGTLLGGSFYVDLRPGTGLRADSIPVDRTDSQVEFDELLQPFGGHTPAALRSMLGGLRAGLSDAPSVGAALRSAAATSRTVADGVGALTGRRDGDLRRLVAASARTAGALGAGQNLERFLDGAERAFGALSRERRALEGALRASPGALDATRQATRRLSETLDRLDPLVAELHGPARLLGPTATRLRPALRQTEALLRDASPVLGDLRPALRALRRASANGEPALALLEPTVARLRDDLLPFLRRVDPSSGRSTAQMIGPAIGAAGWGASEFDGGGNWLHFPALGDERTLITSPCQTHLSDPTAVEKVRCEALDATLRRVLGGTP